MARIVQGTKAVGADDLSTISPVDPVHSENRERRKRSLFMG